MSRNNQFADRNCIGVIGVGIMGEALISGLLSAGYIGSSICIADKRAERVSEIAKKYGVSPSSPEKIATECDAILFVVKPQDMATVLDDIGSKIPMSTLLVSFAAGKKTSFVESRVMDGTPVLRVMPNTPLLLGRGMSAISAGRYAIEADIDFITNVLSASSEVIVVGEDLQDAVTATSGSGPAYFFYFVEAMIKGAMDLGLSEKDATTLTIQTINGAATMLNESGKTPTTLRENVTSPNGTTAAAIASFEQSEAKEIIAKAMKAARDRSQELA